MGELAQAYVQVIPSARGIKDKLRQEFDGPAEGTGRSAGLKIGGAMVAAIAAAGIGTALKKSILQGANLEQALGGVETLYKNHANTVIANADRAWRTAGISANDYMEQSTSFAASLLQSLGGDTKKAAEYADMAIIDMSDNANKFGTNIQDIQNAMMGFSKQNFTMLDNLKLGYGGTRGEMERLLADASKLSGKKYDISSLADMYEAIHVVQTELGVTGTTALEAQETLSGSFASMKAAADNFLGNLALGRNIEDSMRSLTSTTATFLFSNLIPAVGNVIRSLPAAMSTFIQEGVPQLMSAGQDLINGLAKGFAGTGNVIKSVMPMLTGISAGLASGAGKLIDAGLEMLQNIATGIADGLPAFIENAPNIISNIANAINTNAPKLLVAGVKIIFTLAKGIIQAIPTLVANIPAILRAVFDAWMAFNWVALGRVALMAVKKGMLAAGKTISGAVKGVMNKVKTALTKPIQAGRTIIAGIVNKIKSLMSFSGLSNKVASMFNSIKSRMLKPLQAARAKISGIISSIKAHFPFNVGDIIHFRVPSISLKTASKSVLGKEITYPTGFNIAWHAEGGIFTQPTILGNHGFGDAGPEAIMPLSQLWSRLDALVASQNNGGNITVVMQIDGEEWARRTVNYIDGDTLMFNVSPV